MRSVILILSLCALQVFSETPQDDWTNPINPQSGQADTVLTAGQPFTIGWNGNLTQWFPEYAPYTLNTSADLWITGYDLHQYQHLVASRVNVVDTRTVTWRVNIPADEVQEVGTWVFRFIQSGIEPNQTQYEVSSAECIVQADPSASTSTTMSSTSSTTSTSSSTMSSTTSTTSTTSTSSTSASATAAGAGTSGTTSTTTSTTSSGLSTGAKAGIAVGAVLGAILLIGAGWFLARRKPKDHGTAQPVAGAAAGGRMDQEEKQFVQSGHQPAPPYSQQQAYQELQSNNPQRWHEPAELGNNH